MREPDWSEGVYLVNELAQRFVCVVQDGARSVVAYGAHGSEGQRRERAHGDAAAAARWCRRQVHTLRHKGYRVGHCRLSLVEAIQEAPESLSHYRAYASWLTEKGDPRGELIALGLRLLEPEASPDHQRAFDELRKRHPETLDVATLAPSDRQTWHAGFIRAGVIDLSHESRQPGVADTRLRRYLTHPSMAAAQRLTVLGFDLSLARVIPEAAPKSIEQIALYGRPGSPWWRSAISDGEVLRFRWSRQLPSLRSVVCDSSGPLPELDDEPAPRGAWVKLLRWLGL